LSEAIPADEPLAVHVVLRFSRKVSVGVIPGDLL